LALQLSPFSSLQILRRLIKAQAVPCPSVLHLKQQQQRQQSRQYQQQLPAEQRRRRLQAWRCGSEAQRGSGRSAGGW